MDWIQVDSSNVDLIGYDHEKRDCYIKFKSDGSTYVYSNVSPEQWRDLLETPSKGRYVQVVLRRGHQAKRLGPTGKKNK